MNILKMKNFASENDVFQKNQAVLLKNRFSSEENSQFISLLIFYFYSQFFERIFLKARKMEK